MMFNGAKKYGPKQFDTVMERAGGRNNAYTCQDLTVYTNFIPKTALEITFDLEAGLNRGEVDGLISRIDSVTLEQANAVSKKYSGQDNLVFVLVCDAAKIRTTAAKYANEIVEVPISNPGFTATR